MKKGLHSRLVQRAGETQADAPVDPRVMAVMNKLIALVERYFRAEVYGLDKIPPKPVLLVGNHNAGITFLEPFFLGRAWYRHTQGTDPLCFLGHDVMVSLPGVGTLLKRLGVVRASHVNAETALRHGRKVMVFPGGNYEAFRPFSERNKVDFGGKTGFVRLALKARVDIVPVLSFGGHETFFVLSRGSKLAKFARIDKLLRSESCPLFVGLPWGFGIGPIFHWPLPSKTLVDIGDPVCLQSYSPTDASNPRVTSAIAGDIQMRLQDMMDRRAGQRRWPVIG